MVTQAIKSAKRQFYNRFLDTKQSAKILWNKFKSLGVYGDHNRLSDNFIAQDVNDYFTNNQQDTFSYLNFYPSSHNSFKFSNISLSILHKTLWNIKSNSVGCDGVHIKFLESIFNLVSIHILNIFNTVLSTSVFPSAWKKAIVRPIPKISNAINISDLRPISILSVLSKIFEIIIKTQIIEYLNINDLLYYRQSGFRANHSTTSTLLDITEIARNNFERNFFTILICLDFSKAFDNIDHEILMDKLSSQFNFSYTAIRLFYSYLRNRSQSVIINEQASNFKPLYRGVPQGSFLGPLLFCL